MPSASEAQSRIFDLYLKNGDLNDTITFAVSTVGESCYEGTPGVGEQVGQPVPPGGRVRIQIARIQGHGCDGENGYFSIEMAELGGSRVGFNFDNSGTLVLTNSPNDYVGILSAKSPSDESYTWSTLPKPVITASKPVGMWDHVCQQFCDVTFKQEIFNSTTNSTETSRETTNALSVSLQAGLDFPGGSAESSVTASQETSVGQTMSRELTTSSMTGREIKVNLSLEQMEERGLFAVWQWIATSRLSNDQSIILKTTKYTCTPDGFAPSYLPGSVQDINSCQRRTQPAPAVTAAALPVAAAPPALNFAGTYRREPRVNDWNEGVISGNPLRWTNNAGASWGFGGPATVVSDTRAVLNTTSESPYFSSGGATFDFVLENGQVIGFTTNGEPQLYRRIGD